MIRIIVTGGRDYTNRAEVWRVLDMLDEQYGVERVATGGARGADTLAIEWAREHQVQYQTYEADWSGRGLGAGPTRNSEMLAAEMPNMVVAFPGNRGTADMVRKARRARVEVVLSRDHP